VRILQHHSLPAQQRFFLRDKMPGLVRLAALTIAITLWPTTLIAPIAPFTAPVAYAATVAATAPPNPADVLWSTSQLKWTKCFPLCNCVRNKAACFEFASDRGFLSTDGCPFAQAVCVFLSTSLWVLIGLGAGYKAHVFCLFLITMEHTNWNYVSKPEGGVNPVASLMLKPLKR